MELELPTALSDILSQLLAFKQQGDGQIDQSTYKSIAELGALKILEFKSHHRQVCENAEVLRETTAEAKNQLDHSSLQLQNLLYERQHYEKEINGCRTYKSSFTFEQLELLSLEEFAAQLDVQAGSLVVEDPHQLMLNRLKHELSYRQKTLQELEALKSKRDALAAEVAQQRNAIGGIASEVATLRDAALKVQQQFNVAPVALQTQLSDNNKLALLLPFPLYVLYCSLQATAAAHALPVSVAVEGNPAEAEQLRNAATPPNAVSPASGPHDPFPLAVTLAVSPSNEKQQGETGIVVKFQYLPSLKVAVASGATSQQDALLASLFEGDSGKALPLIAAAAAAATSASNSAHNIDISKLPGKPYTWVQHAAALDTLPQAAHSLAPLQATGSSIVQAQTLLQQHIAEKSVESLLNRLIASMDK